jgi:UDP-N-acetyl-D-mannosaminuronate dehydrogenase
LQRSVQVLCHSKPAGAALAAVNSWSDTQITATIAPGMSTGQYDCVLIVTDHSDYYYRQIVSEAKLVVDTRNATRGIKSEKIVHC